MNYALIIYLLTFIVAAHTVYGETASAILQQNLNNYHTLSAEFNQSIYAKGRIVSRSSGFMSLKRPDCAKCYAYFYWYTKKPIAQKVVADGRKLWIYDIDLQQVTVRKQKHGMGSAPALFLSGYNDAVARNFIVENFVKTQNQCYLLRAKARHENFQRVALCFKGNSLISIELMDPLGQRTVVKLNNVKINSALPVKLFKFTPPKGVDVIGNAY